MTSSASSDPELLAEWLNHRHEPAFRELVARYAGLVRATALRTCGDDSLAAEAAQLTFIALARKAKSLVSCASLGGWLHRTAMLQAKNLLRKSQREHRKRELLQTAMETEPPTPSPDAWQDLQPVLDDALAALSAKDREALLLRFYRALSVKEIAATLGIATDAAQKRVNRATDRLRGKLLRRGCQAGGSLSAVMLAGFASDAQAAAFAVPLFTAKAIAAGAVSSGAFTATTAFLTASTMKTTSAVVPLLVLLASGVWLAGQFRSIAELERENTLLQNQVSDTANSEDPPKSRSSAKTALEGKAIDWETVGERFISEYERYGDTGSRVPGGRWYERLGERLDEMSPPQLTAALDQIAAAGLSKQARKHLELGVFWRLGKKEPEMALERLITRCGDSDWDSFCGDVFEDWLKQDREAAIAWFDRQLVAATARHHGDEPQSRNGGSRVAGYPELAKFVLGVHPVWNRPPDFLDGLVIRLLEHDQAGNDRKLARSIAECLSDRTHRAIYLEKFK